MGAKQSQDSTVSELPPGPSAMPSGVVGGGGSRGDEDPEGDGILIPPIFPSLLSTSSSSSAPGHRENGNHQRRSPRLSLFGRQGNERSERSGEAMSQSFSGSHEERTREHHHRHHHHHHHHHHSSSNGHRDRPHHHHHRRHREHGERRSHDSRRARRYLHDSEGPGAAVPSSSSGATNSQDPLELDLNFSLLALNQRLRALQLRRESEENGGEGDYSISRRHRSSRTHGESHSHSRNPFAPGSVFFMRPSSRRSRCPVCGKDVPPGDMETHIVMCMTKPAVEYNEDRLLQDAGECSICLEDMETGDKIARLPCLCVYHLKCLKLWYEKNKTCPEHPEYYGT